MTTSHHALKHIMLDKGRWKVTGTSDFKKARKFLADVLDTYQYWMILDKRGCNFVEIKVFPFGVKG
jgi:hypothetical protein